jgi:hypothetical protein
VGRAGLPVPLGTRPLRTHPFAPDARQRPGETPVRTALSPRYLIRMRSQVQVLAGPPPIAPGQSAVGSEPGAPAASLGRAGAAPPSPPARASALSGPPTQASASATTTHRGRHPAQDGSHAAGAALRCNSSQILAQPPATRAPHAGLACWSLTGQRGRRRPHPTRPGPHRPPLTDAPPRQRRRPQACWAVDRAAPRRGSPPGPRPVPVVTGCPPHRPGPHHHRLTGRDGRVRIDGVDTGRVDTGRVDTGRVDSQGLDAERVDSSRPDRRVPRDDDPG